MVRFGVFVLCLGVVFFSQACQKNSTGGNLGGNGLSGNNPSGSGGANPPSKCGSTLDVTWTPPTTNTDGSPLTNLAGFNIYYGTASGNYTNTVNINSPTTDETVISSLAPATYYLAATALNAVGVESAKSAEVNMALQDCTVARVNALTGEKHLYDALTGLEIKEKGL